MRLLNSRPRIKDLRAKHIKHNSSLVIGSTPTMGKATFVQDASNCWMYAAMNNLKVNTGIEASPTDVKNLLEKYTINTSIAGDFINSSAVICELYGVNAMTVDVLKDTKTFAENIKKGYAFIYSRNSDRNFIMDIIDNGKIDGIHNKSAISHATNGILLFPTIKELGSWGDRSKANSFTYDNLLTFVSCIRAGAINSQVLFIYK